MARLLSQERLQRLYTEALPFASGEPGGGPVPSQFQDLGALALRSHIPGIVHIRLQGCFDHHVDLVAFGESHQGPRIELWYSEHPRQKEVLWQARQ